MSDFLTFFNSILSSLATFLSTEPIIWFVGVFLVLFVAGLVKRLIS